MFLIFLSSYTYAERSFNTISVSYFQVEVSDGMVTFDGDGSGADLNLEIANQFYFMAGTNKSDYTGDDFLYSYNAHSKLNLIGVGRYSKVTANSKISYYFLTGDPKQKNTRISRATGLSETYEPTITRGQRIGVSYIYDATRELSFSGGMLHDDFGTYEESGYYLDTVYSAQSGVGFGLGYISIADTS